MLAHEHESTYALTWINAQGEGFMKNYVHPTGHESAPCKPKEDLIFHLLCLTRSMDTDCDMPDKIAEFKRINNKTAKERL